MKTMVIVGDADGVKLEHALAKFKLRGGGDELAAASGVLQLLVPIVSAFLDDVPPTTPELF